MTEGDLELWIVLVPSQVLGMPVCATRPGLHSAGDRTQGFKQGRKALPTDQLTLRVSIQVSPLPLEWVPLMYSTAH